MSLYNTVFSLGCFGGGGGCTPLFQNSGENTATSSLANYFTVQSCSAHLGKVQVAQFHEGYRGIAPCHIHTQGPISLDLVQVGHDKEEVTGLLYREKAATGHVHTCERGRDGGRSGWRRQQACNHQEVLD